MIFHSLDFVAFFVVFTVVYWTLPHRGQNLLLFAGSYFFYGYVHPWFLILIATSTVDRLLRRPRHGGLARPSPPLPLAERRLELRDAGLLQVLQLLRRERRRARSRRSG